MLGAPPETRHRVSMKPKSSSTATKTPRAPRAARAPRKDGESTARRIYLVALDLFRARGFDETTMRDVAKGAGLSLGAAYHHFTSKDSILLAYFDEQVSAHEALADERLAGVTDLRERLGIAFDAGLEVRRRDRALLSALARVVLDRSSPASLFGESATDVRRRSIAIFSRAIDVPMVSADVRPLMATALWAMHLGVLLYFVTDDSPRSARTEKLVSELLDLVPPIAMMFGLPAMEFAREKLVRALADAGIPIDGGSVVGSPTSEE
jgi:AcrR family transcriptional regulator